MNAMKALVVAAVIGIFGTGFHYVYSLPAINSKHHVLYNDNILFAEAELDRLAAEMMRVEKGQQLHYDYVETHYQDFQRRIRAARVIPDFIQDEKIIAEINHHLDTLDEQSLKLYTEVQNFKRYFSLLRNSRNHLPVMLSELNQAGNTDSNVFNEFTVIVYRVIKATMLGADSDVRDAILRDVERLRSNSNYAASSTIDIDMFYTHVEIALMYDQKVERSSSYINKDIIPAATSSLDEILETYEHVYFVVQDRLQASNTIVYIGSGLFMLLIIGMVASSKRKLERALDDFSLVIGAQAEGDFSQTVSGSYRGRLLKLKENINGLSHKLGQVIGNVSGLTESIGSTANYIADFATQYESEIHAISEDIESSKEFMTAIHDSSSDFADKANNAKNTAQESCTRAGKGAEAMDTTVSAMQELLDVAQEMEAITNNIDGIAFQTNLLALNAAVEAARAGENGAGFAVVAQEVRSLSGRTTMASKEIRELITVTIAKIENGNHLMQDTHGEISGVIGEIEDLSSKMEQISHSTGEQTSNVGRANTSIVHVGERVQGSLGSIQKAALLANDSLVQSKNLNELVGKFKLA